MNLPFHPIIVHFPITLFIFAFIIQALHLWRPYWICRTTSMWLLGFGVLTSFGAMLSGQKEAIKSGAPLLIASFCPESMAPNDVKTPNPKSHMEVVLHIQYGLHKCSA